MTWNVSLLRGYNAKIKEILFRILNNTIWVTGYLLYMRGGLSKLSHLTENASQFVPLLTAPNQSFFNFRSLTDEKWNECDKSDHRSTLSRTRARPLPLPQLLSAFIFLQTTFINFVSENNFSRLCFCCLINSSKPF